MARICSFLGTGGVCAHGKKKRDPPAGAGGPLGVRKGGLEPPRPKAQEPKSCVSANFTTRAWHGSVSDTSNNRAGKRTTPDASFYCSVAQA